MYELVKLDVSMEYFPKVYIFKKRDKWHWKFQLPNGHWFYSKAAGENEREVKENARIKERDLSKGLFLQKELSKLQATSHQAYSLLDGIEDYIESLILENAAPKYYKDSLKELKTIAKQFRNNYKIEMIHEIKDQDARKYRKDLLIRVKKDEMKRVSAFKKLNLIKRLFKWLKKNKKILIDPWAEVDRITVSKDEKVRRVAPPKEIIPKLMNADYKHRFGFPIKEFAYGLYRTGARKEELLYLEVQDVDWETGLWKIHKKRCPTKDGMTWFPKYGKNRVTIIPKDLLKLLKPLVDRAMNNRVVGYTKDEKGNEKIVEAKFIFTMRDRSQSLLDGATVYRRIDNIRGAWGGLFIAAGIAEPKLSSNDSTKRYLDGTKKRSDYKVPYTRHDMRRGFNVSALEAGMSLDDRALLLGHAKEVNESHYCGKSKLDTEKILNIVNKKMWKKK